VARLAPASPPAASTGPVPSLVLMSNPCQKSFAGVPSMSNWHRKSRTSQRRHGGHSVWQAFSGLLPRQALPPAHWFSSHVCMAFVDLRAKPVCRSFELNPLVTIVTIVSL